MTITENDSPPGRSLPTRARNRQTSEFFDLSQQVKDAGLMHRGAQSYIPRAIALVIGCALAGTLLVMVGQSWWQLAVAAGFGVLFTQLAFVSHDAAHQQVFATGKRNDWLALIAGNLLVGLSYGWWTKKHNRHHAHPNTVGKDGDISPGTLAFVPEDAAVRTGIAGWFVKRQGWFFFPLLTFFGIALHVAAIKALIQGPKVKRRGVEASFLAVRLIGYPALILWLLGWGYWAGA